MFENIECEWPLFLCFLLIDAVIRNDHRDVTDYRERLDKVLLRRGDGLEIVPQLYVVPEDKVTALRVRLVCTLMC